MENDQDDHAALYKTTFRTLRFVIEEVHPGQKYNDTCVWLIVPWV